MTCHNCRIECKRKGHDRKGNQRYQCRQCSKTFLEPQDEAPRRYVPAPRESRIGAPAPAGRQQRFECERLTEVHHTTILKLLVLAGEKARADHGEAIVNVAVRDVEFDEAWAFIGKKQKRVQPDDDPSFGDCYTFVAIERHSKLVLNIAMGKRDQATTDVFVEGVRHATKHGTFKSRPTDSRPTGPRSPPRCTTAATTPCSSRSTKPRRMERSATALRKSPPWRKSQSWAVPTRSASALR